MATTLHASHNFDTTAADEMDLRSDNGLDFGDGDIELDLAPPDFRDDDVSIKDAQEDVITADQDDEMTDPDGEETAQYGTQENYVSPSNNAADFEPVDDEDVLIDYSDEEVEIPAYPFESPDDPVGGIHVAGNDSEEQQAQDAQTNVHILGSANDEQAVPDHFIEDTGTVQHAANEGDEGEKEEEEGDGDDDEDDEEELQQHYAPEFDADNEADAQTDGEDGGVELQDSKAQTKNSEHGDDAHEDHSPSEIRPITVNYEGNELWLFKQHDVDDSGDWFLEDISLVHSSLKDLLQAFRVALGEDISHETELGFRFDHLHNMELFEDNTACVAVSLERLVELYHDLHAQDENHDPESFYMSVLSRPRFITLLADVAKYAEQGSGFSGLAAAVAAGETHFLEALSGHSTDYDAGEWENEEAEQHESTELAIGAEPEVEHAEHEEQGDGDESRDDDQEQTEERVEHDDASTSGNVTHADQVLQTENDPTAEGHADCSEEFVHDQAAEQQEGNENYTIDYSDAGDPEEDEVSHSVTHDGPSPSSSTVQGDESAPGEVSTHTVDSGKHEETHDSDEGVDYDAENNDGTHPLIEEHVGPEEKTESYQEYAEAYDQEDPFEGLQPYSTEASVDGDTNQEYTGYEYEDLDQQLEDDFITGADLDETSAGGSADAGLDLTGGDDLLDLENAPEWFVDEESTSKVAIDLSAVHDIVANTAQHEEKDGVVEQPVVAASSAADPVAASSEDLKESPVQGQKRSIDEVGDSVGDALDLTDMKRPRV